MSPFGPRNGNDRIRKLLLFFAIINLADGLGDANGLISQPLTYFLKEVYGWGPDTVTQYLAVLSIPWLIRPAYGLISDFLPLFGYRRKTYLVAANVLATCAYLWLIGMTSPAHIIVGLFVITFGMAVSSTICGALTVESGKGTGLSGTFLNHQWMWYSLAAAITALSGGLLAQYFAPTTAFHVAAMVVSFAPLAVSVGAWFLIEESKSEVSFSQLKSGASAIRGTLVSRNFWVVALFIFLYDLHPAFYTPLYYHMTDVLHFRQDFIGLLHGVWYLGAIGGTIAYSWLEKRYSIVALLRIGVLSATAGTLSYLLLTGPVSALVVNLFAGIVSSAAGIASLTLATEYCQEGSEGFTYALWLSISTLAGQASSNFGSAFYVHAFSERLAPLLVAAAVFTIANLFCIHILRLTEKPSEVQTDEVEPEGEQDGEKQ
jgi:MFS family permease